MTAPLPQGPPLTIVVNGRERVLEERTVIELIQALGLDPGRVAVERNRAIARRADWAETALAPGDTLEIVEFVGGG